MVVEGANPGPRPKAVRLRGVRVHNLKGVDLDVPIGRLVVFTGVSGSGKSSLAFDTLYAEGQRRYVETFSPYTRQFLEALEKPDADLVDGVPPAVAVAQRGGGRRSARSTLGTVTEVAEGLGLLYARVGRVICMSCGAPVEPAGPAAVARAIDALPEGTRYQITFPVDVRPGSDLATLAAMLVEDGFTRTWVNGRPGSLVEGPPPAPDGPDFDVVVDRLVRGPETSGRRLDSIEIAFAKGLGRCRIVTESHVSNFYDGWRCGTCGTDHIAPDPRLFRFNSPLGACPGCSGFGRIIEPDLARIVPDPSKTLRDGAIAPWTTPAYRNWLDDLVRAAPRLGLPLDVPFASLSPAQVATLTQGGPGFAGLRGFFAKLETKVYKVHVRVFLSRWRGERPCPTCKGARLRPEALAVRVLGRNVAEVAAMGVGEARAFLDEVARAEADNPVARRALGQVAPRLDYLQRIGLGYLTLDRPARTLSGGEARRVALTAALGSGLVNTLYVLDEPTVGLHPRDVGRLIASIQALRDSGNSPVVVEHDADLIRAADEVVDVGPGAGEAGGRILYQGPPAGLQAMEGSATGDYLAGRRKVATPSGRRTSTGMIRLEGASGNNLRNIDVEFPLGVLVIVTGVSGSGKSTLIDRTLQPAVRRGLGEDVAESAPYVAIRGVDAISAVEAVDQSPIGRTARSNPVTYLKAFDEIRKAFAATPEAKARASSASTSRGAGATPATGWAIRPSTCNSSPTSSSAAPNAGAPATAPRSCR